MDPTTRADNESMGRIALVLACFIAGFAVPQTAFGAPVLIAHSCGSSCGSLDATGKGTLNVNGKGAEWGSLTSGTVKVQDKSHNGHKDWSLTVNGRQCKTTRDPSNPAIKVCKSTHTIYFSASTTWWLGVSGSGVSASVVASGGFYIKGTGGYHLNGGNRRSWPSGGRFLQL
jgi:hypothetical protein